MLARLYRRLFRRPALTPLEAHWDLNHRVEFLAQQHLELADRIGEEIAAAAAGYLRDFERRADALESAIDSAVARAVEQSVRASSEHTDAAIAALDAAVAERAGAQADAATHSLHDAVLLEVRRYADELTESIRSELHLELDRLQLDRPLSSADDVVEHEPAV